VPGPVPGPISPLNAVLVRRPLEDLAHHPVLFPERLRVVRPVLLPVLAQALLLVQARHRNRPVPDIPTDCSDNVTTHCFT
jgi:hypothetical protein